MATNSDDLHFDFRLSPRSLPTVRDVRRLTPVPPLRRKRPSEWTVRCLLLACAFAAGAVVEWWNEARHG